MENNNFNLMRALNGANIKTRSGKKAKVICKVGNNKILVKVYSNISSMYDTTVKYNLDGSRWSPKHEDFEDLIMY